MEMSQKNSDVKRIVRSAILLVFLVLSSLPFSHESLRAWSLPSQHTSTSSPIQLKDFDLSRTESEVAIFRSFGSRVTGYPGCEKAADHILETFEDLGLNVAVHEYLIPVPMDEGSWITDDQTHENYTAYALWPNAGITSPIGDFSGKLHYAKDGALEELNGLDIKEYIVLLDFNSGKNWLEAAKLGAKGAVFIEPQSTTKYEALDKGSLAPLYFPRLYVNRTVGEILKGIAQNSGSVTLHVNMKWRNVKARNIVGILEGDNRDDVLMVSAHYDSWSIVPAVSPNAEDSIGISALLELARYFRSNKPKQTLWFVAYSGHWQGRTGATEFVEDVIFNTTKRTWLQIGLDISSESPRVDCLYLSTLYGSMSGTATWASWIGGSIYALDSSFATRYRWIRALSEEYSNYPVSDFEGVSFPPDTANLGELVKYGIDPSTWVGTQDDFFMLDTEPLLSATGMSVTFRTQYARRLSWFSPLPTSIDWKNVWPQVVAVGTIINGFAHASFDTSPPYPWEEASPKRYIFWRGTRPVGFATLTGSTVEFSNRTGWYEGVPNTLVRLQLFETQAENAWPFVHQYTISGVNGSYEFHGLVPFLRWAVDAWKLDDQTGRVEYAVDQGFYGTAQGVAGGLRTIVYPVAATVSTLIPLFRCKEVTFFDLSDYSTMRRLMERDYRNPNHYYLNFFPAMGSGSSLVQIYNTLSKSFPIFIGGYLGADGVGCIYVKEGDNIVITFAPNLAMRWPMMVFTNSSEDNPEGNGYHVTKDVTIYFSAYAALTDMYRMVDSRYNGISNFGVRTAYAEQMLQKGRLFFEEANKSYAERDYYNMYMKTYTSLQYLSRAYSESVMPLFNEASFSVIFFALLILPSAVLFERLFFQFGSYRKFIGIACLMALFLFCYSLVHPAFSIMSNSAMTIMSVGVLLLLFSILSIFVADTRDLLETVRVSMLGDHIFRAGRVSVIMHTVTSSVENMRKRPLLTSLIFILIVCVTAAQTSFTSTSYGFTVIRSPYTFEPRYDGILIKNMYGMPPETGGGGWAQVAFGRGGGVLSPLTIQHLEGLAGEDYVASPRVWMYPQAQVPDVMPIEIVRSDGRTAKLSPIIFVGVSSTELELFFKGHMEGPGVFTGRYQCVLPTAVAKLADVKVGDSVYIRGMDVNFTVVGITDMTENIRDFDGKFVSPIDPGFSYDLGLKTPQYSATVEPFSVPMAVLIFVPWELALEHGGFISSIALLPKTTKTLDELITLASTVVGSTSLTTHISHTESGTLTGLRRIFSYVLEGWNTTIIVLMVLILLSILNFMLGTFISRKQDIQTYSTLGLSPAGVIIVFLTEGVTVGFGGAMIGYLVGFGLNQLLLATHALPSSFAFNFVSLTVVVSMLSIVAAVLAASLYPAFLAARLVTPSRERKWRAATKPQGDIWEMPIPFRAKAFEAIGILRYLQEYFREAGSARSGFRVLEVSEVDAKNLSLNLNVILTPVEQNLSQTATITCREEEGEELQFMLILKRNTGHPKLWESRNRAFIDDIRKQSLLWKGLGSEQRRRYVTAAPNENSP